MKKNTLTIPTLCIALFFISGCVSYSYYHPIPTTTPKVIEKGDVQLAGSIGVTENYNQIGFSSYYQFDSCHYLGLQLNLSELPFTQSHSSIIYHNSNYAELLYGKNITFYPTFRFHYGPSIGYGNTHNKYYTSHKSLEYLKYSYQAIFSVNNNWLDVGIGLQASGVSFYNIVDRGDELAVGTEYENDLENLKQHPNCITTQTLVSAGIGWQNIKLYGQYNLLSFVLGGDQLKYDREYVGLTFSVMIPKSFYQKL